MAFAAALYAVVWVPAHQDIANSQLRSASEQVEARVAALVGSTAGTIGADALSALARSLQTSFDGGAVDLAATVKHVEAFDAALVGVLAELRQWRA